MGILVALLAIIVLPAVLATIFVSWLGKRYPAMVRSKRVAVAALAAGLVTVTPGLIIVWRAYRLTSLVPMAAVFVLGLIIAAVVGVPAAFRATRITQPRCDISKFD